MRVTKTLSKRSEDKPLRFDLDLSNSLGILLYCLNRDFALAPRRGSSDLGEKLQKEILGDLLPIVAPDRIPSQEECYSALDGLVRKINQMGYKHRWIIRPLKKETAIPVYFWGTVVNIHGHRWMIERGMWTRPNLRKALYCVIAAVLDGGLIMKLRRCDSCKKFFVSEDPRREFCSSQCRNDYNNKRRLETGYFSELRHKKRQRDLAKARRLSQEGKSPTEMVKEIPGLTLRILRREGLVSKG